MSIHLVGGGWPPRDAGAVFVPFLEESAQRASASGRAVPRVALVLVVAERDGGERYRDDFERMLRDAAPVEPVTSLLLEGESLETAVLSEIDGLLIGGGLTPAYLDAVEPIIGQLRLLVADGLPYLGYSAGAMIAADAAIIGGWRIGEVPVCSEQCGEDLDQVTVAAGIGLVDLSIDVHAAQWGTLTRLIAAVEAGELDSGLAIDEHTALIVGEGALRVVGTGSVWSVHGGDDGVVVATIGQ
ncbi:Type 1 glutamine amidotransferase-like domain-containing protein [Ruicaihuangia caeni]|uniref:Type 1 glutamine amidotransferase-like domain-containing protein n=1 Tax=Ruicaihuangia caeni TaxID=3042517 RepID=UPI00338EE89D